MIKNIKKVKVKFNNKIVGYLQEMENKLIAFQYDTEWIKNGFSISPLSLPLKDDVFIPKSNLLEGLFGVFYDSLPDGWGELLLNRMLNKKGINPSSITSLTKLTIISKNGLGALEYEPCQNQDSRDLDYNIDKLAIDCNKILESEEYTNNLEEIYSFCGPSGGTRPKAHIRFNSEEWIVKFPCRMDNYESGLNEYIANETAKKCGINVNEFKLFESNNTEGYFGAKRFDRDKNHKIHVISLSGILETSHRIPNLDYGHLFSVANLICRDKENLYEIFKRMCFNVYYKNKDDHSKNFSFIYDENKKEYNISPQYDTTKTLNKYEHEMTVNHKGNPNDEDILFLAKQFKLNIDRCKNIMTNIKEIIKN